MIWFLFLLQVHVVLLDPGYILEHTPLASRSHFKSLLYRVSFHISSHLKYILYLDRKKMPLRRQGDHYQSMSANGFDHKDLEEFQKFSHIFSNCLPKPGLRMIELESIYRYVS